ncbi:unnamed protein product [Diabrotica balteata]|uniref:Uncharacterized protein n=1 Tax=Diabrotica balteata TaxID=107213 RepID=A0A9N9SZZ7_DIABA|nr:unnamed protein product [Diabrotica balteata]
MALEKIKEVITSTYNSKIAGTNEIAAEISDDDRMSLTTAVSDEDDGESVMNSPYKAKQTGTAAASFNCTGAVRKAGVDLGQMSNN